MDEFLDYRFMQRKFFDRPGIRFLDGRQDIATELALLRVRVHLDSLAVASAGLALVNKRDCVGITAALLIAAPAYRLPSCEKKTWVHLGPNADELGPKSSTRYIQVIARPSRAGEFPERRT
jgi:hypothetical protein